MFANLVKKTGLALFACCLIHSATAATDTSINRIAAVVNDQVITEANLNQMVDAVQAEQNAAGNKMTPAEIRKQALDQLIARDLQLQMAKILNITVSDDELKAQLASVAAEHHITVEQLPAALQQQGLSLDQFKQQIKDQLLIQKFQQQQLAGNINIRPKEIDALAKKLAKQPLPAAAPKSQVVYHFIDMVIPLPEKPTEQDLAAAKQKFDAIAKAINEGKEDFEAISQQVLGAPTNDLGWRTMEQMPTGFSQVVSKMKPGQVAPPARAANGVHILKLIEVKTLNTTNDLSASATSNTITETHVRHILLKKDALIPAATQERLLLAIRDKIVHGEDFATLAKQDSQDPGTVSNGGDLGWVKPGMLDPKFEEAMNKLAVNEISMPIQSQFGWHLIQVLERKQTQDPQAALRQRAQEILFQQKMEEAVKQLISQLKAQAYIKIFINN